MEVGRRWPLWVAVSVAAVAVISAGTLWGWSRWKAQAQARKQDDAVRQRDLRLEAAAEKARRVNASMHWPNEWNGSQEWWRVKLPEYVCKTSASDGPDGQANRGAH
jgi:type II secretory pathway pseudopilin PulG